MNSITERALVILSLGFAIATFIVVQAFVSGMKYDTLLSGVADGVNMIPSLFAAILICFFLFVGFILLFKKKWIIGSAILLATVFTSPLHAAITANAVKFYDEKEQSLKFAALDLPLSAYPAKYVLLDETVKFISTKENQQRILPCEVSGCLVQVTGHYLDRVKKGQDPVVFSPAGNCDVKPRGKSLSQLPSYSGMRPCYGALMYSLDGGTSFKGILPESNETITSDEVTRQIGLIKSNEVTFKFFIGNQSNGFGEGFVVSTHRPTSPI